MKLPRRQLLRASAATPLLLAGCASAPTHYYRLVAPPGRVDANAAFSIRMRAVTIPAYLRVDGIPKPGTAFQFNTYATDVWAGPFDGMLTDIAVQELSTRLPSCTVVRAGGAIIAPADVVVEANVARFDPDSTGLVTLIVQFAIKSGRESTPWAVKTFTETARPSGPEAAEMVAVMSLLWAGAIDQLAPLIVTQWNARQG